MTYNSPPPLSQTFDRLAGKTVLVTGASSGIGEAAVRLFAAEGANVVATARRRERLEVLADELTSHGASVAFKACDVSEESSVQEAVAFAVSTYGRLDGAFNNAGTAGGRAPIHEAEVDIFDRIIAVNLRGVFLCLKYETAAMLSAGRGGSIVNMSSNVGLVGGVGSSLYASSKWGVAGLTKCAALDYARQNIRVNAIAPGPTRSEMFDRASPTEEARAQVASRFPMNYVAQADDMARAALFLLSDESRWTTGAILPCEGGQTAG